MAQGTVRYLSRAHVEQIGLSMEDMIRCLETMFRLKGEGKAEMPPKPGIHPREDAFIHAMPAYIPDMNAAGMKWVAGYPANHARNLPYITGLMIMNDPETGMPLAVMDCTWITAQRTGAATAVAAKHLARPDASVIGMLGCGVQGESNLEALMTVQKNITTVLCYDIVPQKTDQYIGHMQTKYPGTAFHRAETPRDAVAESDIVVTSGPIVKHPTYENAIEAGWLKKGAFAAPVDFDSYWKPEALRETTKFCTDDREQLAYYQAAGYFRDIPRVHADLGELAAGVKAGRESEDERIVAMNLGLALEDVATGMLIYAKAQQRNIGVELPL